MENEKLIYKFKKNYLEDVCIMMGDYNGKSLIDIRSFINDGKSEMKPTRKGISIRADLISELRKGIEEAEREHNK
ncbi:MAG: transcriptional coactivator p15/PC4 family protein [Candidatus Theseobacter exili]|nr:transcriptional coactivator p15/PC4 family protein [Candidatus Theseobacter exili]